MRKILHFGWLSIVMILIGFGNVFAVKAERSAADDLSFFLEERITYAITKMGIRMGEATLSFEGETQVQGRDAYLIVFRADGFNFFDEERIFADRETWLPLRVERNVNVFGKKEKIVEDYTQEAGAVVITKTVGDERSTETLRNTPPLDNIYCFIYRYRRSQTPVPDDGLHINLPTQELVIKLTDQIKVQVAGKTYQAYVMRSDPRQYQIWLGTGHRQIPLQIIGATGFGNTAMKMTDYQSGTETSSLQEARGKTEL